MCSIASEMFGNTENAFKQLWKRKVFNRLKCIHFRFHYQINLSQFRLEMLFKSMRLKLSIFYLFICRFCSAMLVITVFYVGVSISIVSSQSCSFSFNALLLVLFRALSQLKFWHHIVEINSNIPLVLG